MPEHVAENTTQNKPLVPSLTSQVNHLDSEMDSLLKRQDITQDEKARLYTTGCIVLCHRPLTNHRTVWAFVTLCLRCTSRSVGTLFNQSERGCSVRTGCTSQGVRHRVYVRCSSNQSAAIAYVTLRPIRARL